MKDIIHKLISNKDKLLLNEKGVYQIKHKKNNKVYIGSTSVRFSRRLSNHIRCLLNNKHHSSHLQNAYNIDKTIDNFEISILEICDPEDCIIAEQKWMDLYRSYDPKFGYNINPNAESCKGKKLSKENKIKLFERLRKLTDDEIIKIFYLRNEKNETNKEIADQFNLTTNNIASILTKPNKYKYVKEKYDLKLEEKYKKKFTKEDIIKIHDLYENKKLTMRDIVESTNFDEINLRHLITKNNLYKEERNGLKFNYEKGRKNKIYKPKSKKKIYKKKKM